MVAYPRLSTQEEPNRDLHNSHIKWTTVVLQEVVEKGYRLEASVYGIEGRQARRTLQECRWDLVPLCGGNGLATCYHRPRFKRIYVEKSDFPIYQPAQANEVYPRPSAYISELTRTDIDSLRVKKGQVLLTCSGTIGNCTYVRNTFDNLIFSHDLIRLDPKEYNGFIYAFLKSKIGRLLLTTNNYGAVVKHIEPKHLDDIPIPNPPALLKQEIHRLIEESFRLRDESNELMDETQALLKEVLRLPAIEELQEKSEQFDNTAGVLNYPVPLSKSNNRLDGSYHVPIVEVILKHLEKTAKEIVKIGDSRISQSVVLPSHFKRIYVNEGRGVVLIGGRHLYSLDPVDKQYLAPTQYSEKLKKDMFLAENMIIVSAKGTPGRVTITPSHWNGWFMSSNLIKIVPVSKEIAGFLYCFLSSPYGEALIKRQIYGAVVDIVEPIHIESIVVPFLKDWNVQMEINNMVLEANRKRTEAYELEQEALVALNEKVICARGNGS